MSSTSNDNQPVEAEGEIRQRLPQRPTVPRQASSAQSAKQAVLDLNAAEDKSSKDASTKRTFGRTPGGAVFVVPTTHDMVSQLLSPTQPKNLSDIVVILTLGVHILGLYLLPSSLRIPIFAVVYLFWRASYNGGIGWLLWQQSNYNLMVEWAKKSRVFENPSKGNNPHPAIYKILKREMETKIPKDYKFEEAPIEYNAWLTFRRVVDLILMCDFVSYCLFAIACGIETHDASIAVTITRWTTGIALVLFNLWVKLDAHRVVKDYAWYWGDFFYLIDQELTFDGVFEMAPHPMYSVGYAGYYGISLMAGSYKVLFISIVAHAAQFAFLAWVENPHIEKTYNPPPPRKRGPDPSLYENENLPESRDRANSVDKLSPVLSPVQSNILPPTAPPATKDILGIQNLDVYRVIDVSTLLVQLYFYLLALVTPSTPLYQFFFVSHAVVARLWYSIGIGYILNRQSARKKWTRHFIKYGETTEEAWRQWKGIYHLSMTMCYASFVTAAFKMYSLPPDWQYGLATLRHVLGIALIVLQIWTAVSIYESLGEFGWFFGDFFFDSGPQLTYSGIYRFLNNPERVIGLAGVWGFAILTWSKAIFLLAFLSHTLTLAFIHFIERPHMEKRYGQSLRADSGLSKSFKRSLPASLQSWHGSANRVLDDTADFVEDFIESAAPKFAAGVETIVKDTKALFNRYPARVSITRLAPGSDLANFDIKEYSLEIEGTLATKPVTAIDDKASGREGEMARTALFEGREFQPVMLEYGAPIKVKWSAPINHSKRDWIGLYMLADNSSKDVTRIGTQGRWVATSKGIYDARAEQGILIADKQTIKWEGQQGQPLMTGEMEFSGDKLWWTTGVFEFRYHHDGKHNVMATSKPFEIRIQRFDDSAITAGSSPAMTSRNSATNLAGDGESASPLSETISGALTMRAAVELTLLPIVRNCFDRDPEIAPNAADEAFGALVEREGKFARRVVFALREMFGIEFSPGVVKADGNIRNLAWRVCNAKQVLAPYSMSVSASRRASTPTGMGDGA